MPPNRWASWRKFRQANTSFVPKVVASMTILTISPRTAAAVIRRTRGPSSRSRCRPRASAASLGEALTDAGRLTDRRRVELLEARQASCDHHVVVGEQTWQESRQLSQGRIEQAKGAPIRDHVPDGRTKATDLLDGKPVGPQQPPKRPEREQPLVRLVEDPSLSVIEDPKQQEPAHDEVANVCRARDQAPVGLEHARDLLDGRFGFIEMLDDVEGDHGIELVRPEESVEVGIEIVGDRLSRPTV